VDFEEIAFATKSLRIAFDRNMSDHRAPVNDESMLNRCPLCARAHEEDAIASNAFAMAVADGFPLNPGHALVIPRRHIADLFELEPDELAALWALVPVVCDAIKRSHRPHGFNIGINVGQAAGQTVAHAHVHVIPRYNGDVPDPRGGVRWVLPERADYWSGRT